jgi:hypothetical protein
MAAKLTRLIHKIAIQLHLVAESCTICSSRSRRSVRKLLDAPSFNENLYAELMNVIFNSGGTFLVLLQIISPVNYIQFQMNLTVSKDLSLQITLLLLRASLQKVNKVVKLRILPASSMFLEVRKDSSQRNEI